MPTHATRIAGFLFRSKCSVAAAIVIAAFGAGAAAAVGQTVSMGADLTSGTYVYGSAVNPPGIQTSFTFVGTGATGAGTMTSATFGWSATGCPAAVKLKFFRYDGTPTLRYLGERGPFDVTAAQVPAAPALVIQTVALSPPVPVQQNDFIGITNLTTCGGPIWLTIPSPLPLLPPFSETFAGDVRSDVPPGFVISTSFGILFASARGPAAPAVSVPTASVPGLALLAGVLALAGFFLSRK